MAVRLVAEAGTALGIGAGHASQLEAATVGEDEALPGDEDEALPPDHGVVVLADQLRPTGNLQLDQSTAIPTLVTIPTARRLSRFSFPPR